MPLFLLFLSFVFRYKVIGGITCVRQGYHSISFKLVELFFCHMWLGNDKAFVVKMHNLSMPPRIK